MSGLIVAKAVDELQEQEPSPSRRVCGLHGFLTRKNSVEVLERKLAQLKVAHDDVCASLLLFDAQAGADRRLAGSFVAEHEEFDSIDQPVDGVVVEESLLQQVTCRGHLLLS